jgi:hypothetical protein
MCVKLFWKTLKEIRIRESDLDSEKVIYILQAVRKGFQ